MRKGTANIMKTKLIFLALVLLLILSVACTGCNLNASDPANTDKETSTEHSSLTESSSETAAESKEESTTTGDQSNEESTEDEEPETNDSLDDKYPNQPEDGHTKRY